MTGKLIAIVLLIVLIFALGPLVLLTGINFIIDPMGQQIPYTIRTWIGAFLVMVMMKGASARS